MLDFKNKVAIKRTDLEEALSSSHLKASGIVECDVIPKDVEFEILYCVLKENDTRDLQWKLNK